VSLLAQSVVLPVGPTDNTSAQRTPAQALWVVPPPARASFAPFVERVPAIRPGENDLTRIAPGRPLASGEAIDIAGTLTDERGLPIPHALVEIWNANARGRYTHEEDPAREPLDPHFLGIGRTLTDAQGRYRFRTIRPGAYLARPDIGRFRPAHVHLSILGGCARLVTQMYFAGDPYNAGDPAFILLGDAAVRHLAVPAGPSSYRFDVVAGGRCGVRFERG
jgi:protocatechuate 3,4-dioxygenase beta subunit